MKKLNLILELLGTYAEEMHNESQKCWDREMRYASAYADGKEQAYLNAYNLLKEYIDNELPWRE